MCCLPNDIYLRKGDFNGSPNVYQNKALTGRFRVLMDKHLLLEPTVQWTKLGNGGFSIDIPGWVISDDTIIVVQFY